MTTNPTNNLSTTYQGLQDGVNQELLRLVYQQNLRSFLPMLLVIVMIGFLLNRTQELVWITVWGSVAIAFLVIRLLLLRKIADDVTEKTKTKLVWVCLLSLLNGLTQGACLLFFNDMPAIDRSILSMILLSLGAGSIGTSAGYQPLFWCYISPSLLTLSILWILNINSDIDTDLAIWIGLQMLVLIATLTVLGHDTFKFFARSVKTLAEKEQLTEELSEALKQQQAEKKRAEASNKSKSRFLTAASHDLRQPVHVLNLYSSALRAGNFDAKSQSIVNDMDLAIRDLSRQVNSLMDISKLDSDPTQPLLAAVCLSDLIDDVAREFKPTIHNNGLDFHVDNDLNIWVNSDSELLEQILKNLLSNASKYTKTGEITLQTDVSEHQVNISVTDTGMGIPKDKLDAIFEEFYQLNNPARNSKLGLGIGLSIVKRAASALGHNLAVESTLNSGTRFTITINRIEAPEYADSFTPIASSIEYQSRFNLSVHVVDDEPSVRKSITRALESMGCHVTSAASTEETSEMLSAGRSPDLFIIDLRLIGDDSGLLTHQYVKQHHPNVPSVFVSGEQHTQMLDVYDDNTSVLQKPVSSEQLVTLLENVSSPSH